MAVREGWCAPSAPQAGDEEAVPGSAASGAHHYLEAFSFLALGVSEEVTAWVGIKEEDHSHTDFFFFLMQAPATRLGCHFFAVANSGVFSEAAVSSWLAKQQCQKHSLILEMGNNEPPGSWASGWVLCTIRQRWAGARCSNSLLSLTLSRDPIWFHFFSLKECDWIWTQPKEKALPFQALLATYYLA